MTKTMIGHRAGMTMAAAAAVLGAGIPFPMGTTAVRDSSARWTRDYKIGRGYNTTREQERRMRQTRCASGGAK